MKTEDFERLKALCEKEGFTIESYSGGKTAIIGVKDPWRGVEFAECINDDFLKLSITKGKIYPLRDVDIKDYIGSTLFSGCIDRSKFKPSTEQAYVEQLKKEAHERFGEIKGGDRFIDAYSKDQLKVTNSLRGFVYSKDLDSFCIGGVIVYHRGKWAERVKERVYVTHELKNYFCDSLIVKFSTGYVENPNDIAKFLAQQLEKYLNGEIQ